MRALMILCVLLAGAGLAMFMVSRNSPKGAAQAAVTPVADPVSRGKYLVTIAACNDCHSPHDKMGQVIKGLELSGHPEKAPLPVWEPAMLDKNNLATFAPTMTAFAGPFGTAVAPNLTPDPETGLVLSADGLIASWRSGKHWKFDRPVLPPMPVQWYKEMTDDDIRAVHTYLKTLPEVHNRAPDSIVAPMPGGGTAPNK